MRILQGRGMGHGKGIRARSSISGKTRRSELNTHTEGKNVQRGGGENYPDYRKRRRTNSHMRRGGRASHQENRGGRKKERQLQGRDTNSQTSGWAYIRQKKKVRWGTQVQRTTGKTSGGISIPDHRDEKAV